MGSEQKVAVITGASRGIGAALVKAYVDRNYRVVATARSIKASNDADILAVPGDIADRKTAERAISEGMTRFGRIDTLVNNAGIFIAKPFTQYTEADFAAILGVNVTGFFHMTQLAIAEMEKQRSGHVVQISTSLVDHASSAVPRCRHCRTSWNGASRVPVHSIDQGTRNWSRKRACACKRHALREPRRGHFPQWQVGVGLVSGGRP